jgi:hypothetical protein
MADTGQTFTLTVSRATFIPDEAAMRAFVEQLNAALASDKELRARFEADPREVLCERGVALDFQRELLIASGVTGLENDLGISACPFTCLFSQIDCHGTGGSGGTVVIHATE